MKTVEKVYIGCAAISVVGLLLGINGVVLFQGDAYTLFALFSFMLGLWGLVLISRARKRKATTQTVWGLIVATILGSLFGINMMGSLLIWAIVIAIEFF